FQGTLNGNPNARTNWNLSASYQVDELAGNAFVASAGLLVRPAARWDASITPRYARSTNPRQYITTLDQGPTAHVGSRYLFGFIDHSTVAAQFRLNFAFTPNLTIQGYAEPFASSGHYYRFGELTRPRSGDLRTYGQVAGTSITPRADGTFAVT